MQERTDSDLQDTTEIWSGGDYNDPIVRLDPKTGAFMEYLMPGHMNVRRGCVDNKSTPVRQQSCRVDRESGADGRNAWQLDRAMTLP